MKEPNRRVERRMVDFLQHLPRRRRYVVDFVDFVVFGKQRVEGESA